VLTFAISLFVACAASNLKKERLIMTKKTKSKAKANNDMLRSEIQRLHEKRVIWQEGAYKRSNEALYEVLEGCHEVLNQLRSDLKLRKKLNKALEDVGFTVRSNTSIELKVVRAVFGVENNRTQAYTRVLQLAKKDLPEGWKLAEWIEDRGGVEEVRRTPKDGPTLAEQAEKNRIHAEEVLANIDATVPRFKPIKSLQPKEGGDYQFSVALVRVDSDGKAAIVFGTNKNALVKSVLTEAGKGLAEQEEPTKVPTKQSTKRKSRDEVLASTDGEVAPDTAIAA
jgi:hypothetical protein